jgi:hypothetical protein
MAARRSEGFKDCFVVKAITFGKSRKLRLSGNGNVNSARLFVDMDGPL